jgi:geranylgeranyl diphosphate synthase type I
MEVLRVTGIASPFPDTTIDRIEPHMRAAVQRLAPRVRLVAGYHCGWWDSGGTPTGGGRGKALRPALALLSASAAGKCPETGVPAAVAVELVHNFSLLHDDVMDGDTRRRHRPTAASVFGTAAAVLAGDALLVLASEVLAEHRAPNALAAQRHLAAATQRMIAGQAADLEFEGRDDVTLAECVGMASDKTAALISCACVAGALLADATPALCSALARFGEHLGVAYQLTDDLLGIWGSPEVTGKPVFSDLRAGKKTLPVVAALSEGGRAADRLRAVYGRTPTDDDALRTTARLIEDAGGRAWAEGECSRRLSSARSALLHADLPTDVHEKLMAIARFATRRER